MAGLRFKDLNVWKVAMDLAVKVYNITRDFPDTEKYGLISQLQRAAISIPSNIAEGSGRGTKKDFAHFLDQARGSLFELITQLELSRSIGYGNSEKIKELEVEYETLAKRINSLIRSMKSKQNELTSNTKS